MLITIDSVFDTLNEFIFDNLIDFDNCSTNICIILYFFITPIKLYVLIIKFVNNDILYLRITIIKNIKFLQRIFNS